jgi:hypothetical protein
LGVTVFNGGENAGDVAHGPGLQIDADARDYSGSVPRKDTTKQMVESRLNGRQIAPRKTLGK